MQIEAHSISVGYGARRVLHDLSVSLRSGEFVGLIGPNGAGKSTLIRALAGVQDVASGRILIGGRDAVTLTRQERARCMAYLAQKQTADWPLRAYDIVMLGRLPHRAAFAREKQVDHDAVVAALHAVDMSEFGDRILDQLSGGERARIMLARALAVDAPLLFADEPVAALDPLHQLRVMDLLQARVRQKCKGVVIVLHDLALAVRYCDRILVLDHGQIKLDASPDHLSEQILAEVYGVDIARGLFEGGSYLLPWRIRDA